MSETKYWGKYRGTVVNNIDPEQRGRIQAIVPGQNVVLQTTLQNAIIISDSAPTPVSGGIMLKSTTGAMIVVNDSGIYISNGKGAQITMIGPTIMVNQGALVVT